MKILHLGFASVILLSGCMTHHTEYNKEIKRDINNLDIKIGEKSDKKLSDLFKNHKLSELINIGLKNNPNINNTIISLQIAKLEAKETLGESLPNINAGITSSKDKSKTTIDSGNVTVRWEVDIWNKIRNANTIADQLLELQKFQLENVRSLLVADIIRKWVDLNLYNKQIYIEKKRLDVLKKSQLLVENRYSRGIGEITDLFNIEQKIYISQSALENYKNIKNQNLRYLNALIGDVNLNQYNIDEKEFLIFFPTIELLGKQNLINRPDLKIAYKNIEVKDLSTKIAYKNMLPTLNLSAAITNSRDKPLNTLLTSPLWNLLGQLTTPIFNGGSLKARAEISGLEIEQAYWNYQQTLLNAVKEVSDYVELEGSLKIRQDNTLKSLKVATSIEILNLDKYTNGLITISEYLKSQRDVFSAEEQLNIIIKDRIKNRINLGIALGLGA
jgi:outer membrane protein TolC